MNYDFLHGYTIPTITTTDVVHPTTVPKWELQKIDSTSTTYYGEIPQEQTQTAISNRFIPPGKFIS